MKLEFVSSRRLAMPIMTYPGIELIQKTVYDAVTNGTVHADAICALAQNTPSDAATVIMDLTVEAEAFGAPLKFFENEVPSVAGRLLHNIQDVEALAVPDLTKGRTPEYLKANAIAVSRISDRPVLAGCIGPYSLASRLYDMSELMMAIYIDPDLVKKLLDKSTAYILAYVQALKETGVAGVIVAEPAAGLLGNDDAYTYSTLYVKRIVEALQDENFKIILHNCGNSGHCTESMVASDAFALHFGNQCDMLTALSVVPSDRMVMGNIDPVSVFKNASAEEVYAVTQKMLEETKHYNNFVLSTGCDVPPGVPWENVKAFYAAVSDYNNQRY